MTQTMSSIIFDLDNTKQYFQNSILFLLKGKSVTSPSNTAIDDLYSTIMEALVTGLIEDIKNKKLNESTIDSSGYITDIADNLMFLFYDKFSIDVNMQECVSFCSTIENGLIEDIGKALPNIDNEDITILGYNFCFPNSVVLEFRKYENIT